MEIFGVSWEIFFVYLLLLLIFISFIVEKVPADITAMGGMVILIIFGILGREEALEVFSNPAPITIGAMFILSAALERTGCIQILGRGIAAIGGKSELTLMLAFMPVAFFISAFMNNTPVVIVLTPVIITLARRLDLSASRLLIPLSYAAIMGGTCTLIGTSTNLLVSGITVEEGLAPFGIFEITVPGLIMAGAGFTYLLLIGRLTLPRRQSLSMILGGKGDKKYTARLIVPHESKLIDQPLQKSALLKGEDTKILDVLRHGDTMTEYLDELIIKEGDRIVMETTTGELLGIIESGLVTLETSGYGTGGDSAEDIIVAEGIVAQGAHLIGRLVGGLALKEQYGITLLGFHRPTHTRLIHHDTSVLQSGDALLMAGPAEGMQRLFAETGLINLTIPEERPIRRQKAPIAVVTLALVVILAALDVMPIALLSLIGAGVVTVSRCVDPRDIYRTIDWSILFLIFGMLAVSQAMESTGAAALIVDNIVGFTDAYGPLVLLAVFYILTSFLTEIVSNNAVAALLAPIAIGVAASLGLDPKPFLVAVMFGASASFATPIGYQTNTFVYAAGGYKFRDFLVVGLPMNIIMFFVAMIVIPLFWPLETP
jgi:di/tricarboxylate transporter